MDFRDGIIEWDLGKQIENCGIYFHKISQICAKNEILQENNVLFKVY